MKSKYFTLLIMIAGILSLAKSNGRSGEYAGATGDTGDCSHCHGGGTVDGSIILTGLPTSMQPNTTYPMTITVNDADAVRAGFQILATDGGANNTLIGSFNTTVNETKLNDVNRLVQSAAKSIVGGTVSWNIEWVSPAVVPASSQVKFYVAGNAGNGSGTGGDATYATTSATISLPVELIAFNGKMSDEGIILEWATATETNNKGFEVQKSNNGEDWQILDFVQGNGTTIENQVYEFIDNTPFTVNYYRLKQQDFDGRFEYSEIIRVERNTAVNNVTLYPNPAVDRIIFSKNIDSPIRLFDMNGRLIRQYSNPTNNSIDVSMISKGIYFLEFENENTERQIEKIVISK
ncbi:MAG: T9SS type A sorting domain-containing protein [Saprospiraceae bacterium]